MFTAIYVTGSATSILNVSLIEDSEYVNLHLFNFVTSHVVVLAWVRYDESQLTLLFFK